MILKGREEKNSLRLKATYARHKSGFKKLSESYSVKKV
jgi:hypothetical protein